MTNDERTDVSSPDPELVTLEPVTTAVIRGLVPTAELADFFDQSFGVLGKVLATQGVTATGPAFALYYGPPTDTIDLEVGFPTDRPIEPDGSAAAGTLPGGRAVRWVYAGGFDGLAAAWQQLAEWAGQQGLTPGEIQWEIYLVQPNPEMDPADLRTELVWPLA